MNRMNRTVSGLIALIVVGSTLLAPVSALAQGETGRRNTTIGLGALSGYLFTKGGNKTGAFVATGATAVAYRRYNDSVKARHKRERIAREQRLHRQHVAAIHARNLHRKAVNHHG